MPKHMRMSDVEATTNYLLPRVPTTFEKAYPTVTSIRVEVRPSGEGFDPFPNQTERLEVYNEKNIPAIINCARWKANGVLKQTLRRQHPPQPQKRNDVDRLLNLFLDP